MGAFVKKFFGGRKVLMPKPTWGNHTNIYKTSGLDPQFYTYYDAAKNRVDFDGMMRDIAKEENGSLFLLHACAHNPTGCDPSPKQWDELSHLMKEKQHMVFLDCAYQVWALRGALQIIELYTQYQYINCKLNQLQGFASGNAETDAYAIRRFVDDGHKIMLSQSFAKVWSYT